MTSPAALERLKQGRVQLTVSFDEAEREAAERKAVQAFAARMNIKGFRPGKAPESVVREKVESGQILEEAIRLLLKDTLPGLMEEHKLQPIMPPRVEAMTKSPLTLKIIVVERPEVTIKGLDGLKMDRTEPKADPKDVQRVIDSVLQEQRTLTVVDRATKEGDQVTINFSAKDSDGKAVEQLNAEQYAVTIGSSRLLPGFEPHLLGLKAGDTKDFRLTLPSSFGIEELQGKEVDFHVEAVRVEEVKLPELTDALAKEHLRSESADAFRKTVETSILAQERQFTESKREQELLQEIQKRTHADIAPELLEEEVNAIVGEWRHRLESQGTTPEQWMTAQKKTPEQVTKDFKTQGEERVKLRLGLTKIIEDRKITVTDEERLAAVEELLQEVPAEQQQQARAYYRPGGDGYMQISWQLLVRKALATF